MKKLKVNTNLLALVMVVSLFIGWQCTILVAAFIWCFCEVGENLKTLIVRTVAILAGCLLFSTLWNIVTSVYSLGVDTLEGFFKIIGSYATDVTMPEEIYSYLLTPLGVVMSILTALVNFVILLVKFKFVMSVITNRPMTGVFSKVQEYVNYCVNFANSNFYDEPEVK